MAKTESEVKVGDTVNWVDPDGKAIPVQVTNVATSFGNAKTLVDAAGDGVNCVHATYDEEKKPNTWHWPN